jgi:2'-hydroxyisoflavone reductase
MTQEQADNATMQDVGRFYGALKVKCEETAERLLPGRVSRVRPGYIVGWGDPTDRFTYWPARVLMEDRCGGKMLVPGTKEAPAPIQVIDVRDLAAFLVMIGEDENVGTYNLVGPTETLPKVLEAAKDYSKAKTQFVYVPFDFLVKNEVRVGAETPIIVPPESEYAGFARTSNGAAVAAGLKPRPIEETTRATIDWWRTLPEQRRAAIEGERSQALKPQREQELLEKWAQTQS